MSDLNSFRVVLGCQAEFRPLISHHTVALIIVPVMRMFLLITVLVSPRILLPGLPFACPSDQLSPILALVLGPEPRHTTDLRVLYFHGQIRLAHQALPDQVDAVSDVRGAIHHGDLAVIHFLADDCCSV